LEGIFSLSKNIKASDRIMNYSSYLFTFPSTRIIGLSIIIMPSFIIPLCFLSIYGVEWFKTGFILSLVGVIIPILSTDLFLFNSQKRNPLLNIRKRIILSYITVLIYSVSIIIFTLVSLFFGKNNLHKGIALGVAISTSFRYLGISTLSPLGDIKNLLMSVTPPAFFLIIVNLFLPSHQPIILLSGLFGTIVMIGGIQILLQIIERWEDRRHGFRLLPLLRAFMEAWSEGSQISLERYLYQIGVSRELSVDTLSFHSDAGGNLAAMIVPYIHPGPFRNVGSSGLPQVIREHLEASLGCPVVVPHGISTHAADLTRSEDMMHIVNALVSDKERRLSNLCSPMVRVEKGVAKATCQLFGDTALITLTLSPKSFDDLPEKLGLRISEASRELGVSTVIIDAHNSIVKEFGYDDSEIEDLYLAAIEAIHRASMEPQMGFSVGIWRVNPGDWEPREGMGPDGIATLAIRLDDERTYLYVVLDGNNLVSGLRERMIDAISHLGVDDVEILTTDTHVVNAIGASERGYHPIGERMDREKLIGYVVEAARASISNIRRGYASYHRTYLSGIRVLGEGGLELLSSILDSGFSLFKRWSLVLMPTSLLLASLIIFL
jgi:putative membrane protein